jgi:hypothetical protein
MVHLRLGTKLIYLDGVGRYRSQLSISGRIPSDVFFKVGMDMAFVRQELTPAISGHLGIN